MLTMTLVTPSKKILEGAKLKKVLLPAYNGELEILDNHTTLVTTLNAGALFYQLEGDDNQNAVAISWGYCEIFNNHITVLAETAETAEEIDKARAEKAREITLEKLGKTDFEHFEKLQKKFQRSEARIKAASSTH